MRTAADPFQGLPIVILLPYERIDLDLTASRISLFFH